MNIMKGQFHKRTLEDLLIKIFQVAVVALVLFFIVLVGADVWIKDDIARVEKLKQHFYELAF